MILSTASAYPELTDPLESLIRGAAESIRTAEVDADEADPNAAAGSPEGEFAPPATAGGPGFERGFGTLVMRRIDPPDASGPGDQTRPEKRDGADKGGPS